MARLFYVHWNREEAAAMVRELRRAGHVVTSHWSTDEPPNGLLNASPPEMLVISLDRLPSHGRAVAAAVRDTKRFRDLPVVFVGGEPDKVAATKLKFPHAVYCSRKNLAERLVKQSDLRGAPSNGGSLERRARTPAGYSGTPLPQKLGIKPGHRVALLNAPADFAETLGALPDEVAVAQKLANKTKYDVIVLFAKNRSEFDNAFVAAAQRLESNGGLWVGWPKRASGVVTDLTEGIVREFGLATGLVDNKVCAIDETWSGLRFVIRLKDRPKASK